MAVFIFGELFSGSAMLPTILEWLALIFFPFGLATGLIIAWQDEQLGGIIGLISIGLFYTWNLIVGGSFPQGPYFMLLAFPALLFALLPSTK